MAVAQWIARPWACGYPGTLPSAFLADVSSHLLCGLAVSMYTHVLPKEEDGEQDADSIVARTAKGVAFPKSCTLVTPSEPEANLLGSIALIYRTAGDDHPLSYS